MLPENLRKFADLMAKAEKNVKNRQAKREAAMNKARRMRKKRR